MTYTQVTGFIQDEEGIKPDPLIMEHIFYGPVPTTKENLKIFLDQIRYYRHLIPKYAPVVQPLYEKLKIDGELMVSLDYLIYINTAFTSMANAKSVAPWDGKQTVYPAYEVHTTHYTGIFRSGPENDLKIIGYDSGWFVNPNTTHALVACNCVRLINSLARFSKKAGKYN